MNIWFTSDTHYNHANIIKYCNRPFANVEEMNATMIQRWNEVVQPDDIVFHLGDFAFGNKEEIKALRAQLKGRIFLALGNHDRSKAAMYDAGFDQVFWSYNPDFILKDGKSVSFHVQHHPMPKDKWLPGTVAQLNGHIHEKWAYQDGRYNVGVDQHDFRPVSLDEVLAKGPMAELVDAAGLNPVEETRPGSSPGGATISEDLCFHGEPLYGDGCDLCWSVEMTEYHCRICGNSSYYPEDFKHRDDCPIKDVAVQKLPNWKKITPGSPRSK